MEDKVGYTTSVHKLVKDEVCLHMRPFIEVTMNEHQATRDEVKELKEVVKKINTWNANDVIQYSAIILLILSMLLFQTCA